MRRDIPREGTALYVPRVDTGGGSTSGAGSGDFHQYRIQRRRERARVIQMEKEAESDAIQKEFHDKKAEREKEVEEDTKKKAEKRKRRKDNKKKFKDEKKLKVEATKYTKISNDGSYMENFLKAKAEGRLEEFLKAQFSAQTNSTEVNKDGKRKADGDIKDDEPGLTKKPLKDKPEESESGDEDDE